MEEQASLLNPSSLVLSESQIYQKYVNITTCKANNYNYINFIWSTLLSIQDFLGPASLMHTVSTEVSPV